MAEAANWYERHGGLGERFESAFWSSVEQLEKTGEIHRIVYAGFRRILLRPFPYVLYYRFHGPVLVVALVIHGARDPEQVMEFLRRR